MSASQSDTTLGGRVVSSTSNKFGLAPPPISLDLKSAMFLFALVVAID
jgi:hypothetical protein